MAPHPGDSLETDLKRLDINEPSESFRKTTEVPDPFRNVIRPNHYATDITQSFRDASQTLRTGQLIKDDTFTLFESVSALEIMDPKMDAGCLALGEEFDDQLNILQELLPEEIIGIMDQLMCYEISWHQGWPLAQNLFTSLHIDNLLCKDHTSQDMRSFTAESEGGKIPDLTKIVLRAYCIGIVKAVDLAISLLHSQIYYEEEDINTNTFNRDLLSNISTQDCSALITDAIKWLENKNDLSREHREALQCRLDLRLKMIIFFEMVAPVEEGLGHWDSARALIERIKSTHPLGSPVLHVFSAKLRRKLASTVPPRPVMDVAFESACATMHQLLDDNEYLVRLNDCANSLPMGRTMFYLYHFSTKTPLPLPVTRAALQVLLFTNDRIFSIESIIQVLEDDVFAVFPFAFEPDWRDPRLREDDIRVILARHLAFYTDSAATLFTNVMQIFCQNPCRIRRRLAAETRVIDSTIEQLRKHFYADQEPSTEEVENGNQYDFALWTMYDSVQVLRYQTNQWVLRLGMEQDLYRNCEMAELFCYSSLLATHLNASLSTSYALTEVIQSQAHIPKTMSPTLRRQFLLALEHRQSALPDALLESKISSAFALGLALIYALIGRVSPSFTESPHPHGYSYNQPRLARELRMRSFDESESVLGNASAFLEDKSLSELVEEAEQVFASISNDVKPRFRDDEVERMAEHAGGKELGFVAHKEEKKVLRASIAAKVALSYLKSVVKKYEEDRKLIAQHLSVTVPNGEGREHQWWVVPRVRIS